MPSNHSTRSKRTATTSVPNQPPSRRPRRSSSSASATAATALATNSPSSAASTSTLPAVGPVNFATTSTGPSSAILPALLEQIVSTVTAEVTRRLTPLSQPELSGDVIEAPVVTPAATSTVPQLPGSAVVEQALHSANSAITGETFSAMPSLPGQPYHSVTLPLDSRVSQN